MKNKSLGLRSFRRDLLTKLGFGIHNVKDVQQ